MSRTCVSVLSPFLTLSLTPRTPIASVYDLDLGLKTHRRRCYWVMAAIRAHSRGLDGLVPDGRLRPHFRGKVLEFRM
jgi:hypothetical protein